MTDRPTNQINQPTDKKFINYIVFRKFNKRRSKRRSRERKKDK